MEDDTHELSFIHIAAATADVVKWLTKKQDPSEREKRPANSNDGKAAEQHPDKECEYIEHRLREIAAWERRVSGKK